MNLETLSLVELKNLLTQIPMEIERRQKEERLTLRREIEALAAQRGFSLDELLNSPGAPSPTKNERAKPPVKFRHPSDAQLKWTGRGQQPTWVKAFVQAGGTLEQLRV